MAWQKARAPMADRPRPDNSVNLFKNTERRNDRDPEYRGSGQINGREYWASAWINVSKKDGSKYLSVKFKPKQETYERANREEQAGTARKNLDFDDEVPF